MAYGIFYYTNRLKGIDCHCGRRKNKGKPFCYFCYQQLPAAIKDGLGKRMFDGFQLALDQADKFLGINVEAA